MNKLIHFGLMALANHYERKSRQCYYDVDMWFYLDRVQALVQLAETYDA